jgi:hypothetical protein
MFPFQEDIFSRVPAVFVIALGNYLVPYAPVHLLQVLSELPLTLRLIRVVLDITVIVLMMLLPSWSNGAFILFVTNFITILGIVFATVWTTNQNWIIRRMVEAGVDARTQSTMQFQAKSIAEALSAFNPYGSSEFLSSAARPSFG